MNSLLSGLLAGIIPFLAVYAWFSARVFDVNKHGLFGILFVLPHAFIAASPFFAVGFCLHYAYIPKKSRESAKTMPFLSGFLAGSIAAATVWVLGVWGIHSATLPTNSTSAIGPFLAYLVLPLSALIIALPFFIVGFCTHSAIKKLRVSRHSWGGYLYAAVALILVVLLSSFFVHRWMLGRAANEVYETTSRVVTEVREMPSAQFEAFLKDSPYRTNKFALGALLEHEDLPAELLYKITQIPSLELHDRMWANPPIMGKNKRGLAVMRLVAEHPNVDARTLTLLAQSPDRLVLSSVARNAKTPVPVLRELSQKTERFIGTTIGLVDLELASNPNTSADILHTIFIRSPENQYKGQTPFTRRAVAANRNTSKEDLEKLAQDPDAGVREAAKRILKRLQDRKDGRKT